MRPVLSKSDRKIQPIKSAVCVSSDEHGFDRTGTVSGANRSDFNGPCCDVVKIARLLNCVLNDAIFGIVLIDCMSFWAAIVFV